MSSRVAHTIAHTHGFRLDSLLAADANLAGSDAEFLVLAGKATLLVALELLELLLEAAHDDKDVRERQASEKRKDDAPLPAPLVLALVVRRQELVRLELLLVDEGALMDVRLDDGWVADDFGLPLAHDEALDAERLGLPGVAAARDASSLVEVDRAGSTAGRGSARRRVRGRPGRVDGRGGESLVRGLLGGDEAAAVAILILLRQQRLALLAERVPLSLPDARYFLLVDLLLLLDVVLVRRLGPVRHVGCVRDSASVG